MMLGADHKRRPHKISKKWPLFRLVCPQNVRTGSNPFILSVQTHHKFRKIRSFCTKKCGRPHLKNPFTLFRKMSALDNLPSWLRTFFTDSLLLIAPSKAGYLSFLTNFFLIAFCSIEALCILRNWCITKFSISHKHS